MNGQRVVKVFNHERKSEQEFDALNEKLFESAANAHTFASIMGPIMGNIGNLQFVLTAVLGGVPVCYGNWRILPLESWRLIFSLPKALLSRSCRWHSSLTLLSWRWPARSGSSIMMDEEPETDEGYVTLVNARKDENGEIVECK